MHDEVEHLVSLYDRGGITRRQLLQGLVAVGIRARAAPSALVQPQGPGNQLPVFQARSINHVTLYVSDVARSKAFYKSLTGLPVRAEDPTFCELHLENSFLGLLAGSSTARRH
jgi:catechol-2,3-dioxygenase